MARSGTSSSQRAHLIVVGLWKKKVSIGTAQRCPVLHSIYTSAHIASQHCEATGLVCTVGSYHHYSSLILIRPPCARLAALDGRHQDLHRHLHTPCSVLRPYAHLPRSAAYGHKSPPLRHLLMTLLPRRDALSVNRVRATPEQPSEETEGHRRASKCVQSLARWSQNRAWSVSLLLPVKPMPDFYDSAYRASCVLAVTLIHSHS